MILERGLSWMILEWKKSSCRGLIVICKIMKNHWLLFVTCCLAASCNTKSVDKPVENVDKETLNESVDFFLNEWHQNAADADMAYFEKMASNGIYIGTDPTEYWTTDEFREWSREYFEKGKAWDFKAIERNIYSSENGEVVWFDELLDTWMGKCRGSGVIIKDQKKWRLAHYHLSMAIPNEVTSQVIELIEGEQDEPE